MLSTNFNKVQAKWNFCSPFGKVQKCNRNQPLRAQIKTLLWPASKLTSPAVDFWRDLQPHFALWVYYCGLFCKLWLFSNESN